MNPNISRRSFIKKGTFALANLGMFGGLYTLKVEPFWPEFVFQEMTIPNLSSSLEGKTMMQISDIHVGNRFDYDHLIKSFKRAQKFEPDFVVYTGDYITYEGPEQLQQLETVLESVVRGKCGTLAVLGNHDYGINWTQEEVAEQVSRLLSSAGVQVLRNECSEVSGLNFIGLDDLWAKKCLPETVSSARHLHKANIVLCHNPDVCDLPIWKDYDSWILCGHTHGGQVKPPFLSAPVLPVKNKRYSAGKIDLGDGRSLYINRALGHSWPLRFNVRPEITIFKMRKLRPAKIES